LYSSRIPALNMSQNEQETNLAHELETVKRRNHDLHCESQTMKAKVLFFPFSSSCYLLP
jgi:hypothetical protein